MAKELKKSIGVYLPVSDYKLIEREAARRKVPKNELCRQWIRPHVEELKKQNG